MAELTAPGVSTEIAGRRVKLRPLREEDFEVWHEVRTRCRDWLLPWEPRPTGAPYPPEDRPSFIARCSMRERERQLGTGYAFGIFVGSRFVGEVNLSSVQRGPFQNAYVGYWMDQMHAGRSYVPEACVVLFRFAFEDLGLHRLQVAIIPRNRPSRRVAQKLWLRGEGIALRYLEIDGKWEDHVRYAITSEEWAERRDRYIRQWLAEPHAF
ncbi:MAG TPA: GNAT family protein [Acidimicrobiales bacterium]|jgi:ribosomal-protein-alanine N-acetyltransferase|nr:GNAT family protein [Acidimicrobiales bacterium]